MKVKKITLILALFMVLVCCLGAVSAAEDAGSDVAASDDVAVDEVVGEIDSNDESISANEQADDVDDTNSALSAEENDEGSGQDVLKTGTRTVDVNDFTGLKNAINSAANDEVNDTYVINLNPGTYTVSPATTFNAGTVAPNIIINGNGQSLGSQRLTFGTRGSITINDLTISSILINTNTKLTLNNVVLQGTVTNNMNLTIIDSTINKAITNNLNLDITNSTINADISNSGTVTIDDLCKVGSNFKIISGAGKIYTTNAEVINRLSDNYVFIGEYSLDNTAINTAVTNYGRLTIENSTISRMITNYGEITIKNSNTTQTFTNNGNITFIKAQLKSTSASTNNGKLKFVDSIINAPITNNRNITIDDDTIFQEQFKLTNNEGSNVETNNTRLRYYLTNFFENYTFENENLNLEGKSNYATAYFINCNLTSKHANMGINGFKNYGTVYIINSTFDAYLNILSGNVSVENSTLGYKITMGPTATLTIDDDTKFNSDLLINNAKGNLIANNPQILGHLTYIVGNVTISNFRFEGNDARTFKGNIILINGSVNSPTGRELIINNGNLTMINSTVPFAVITNNGNLNVTNFTMMSDSVIINNGILTIGANSKLSRMENYNGVIVIPLDENKEVEEEYGPDLWIVNDEGGIVQTNDLAKIFPYLGGFYQEVTVELGEYYKPIFNSGNVTIKNSHLFVEILNGGNLTIIDSIIEAPIEKFGGNLILINTTMNLDEDQRGIYNGEGIMDLRNATVNTILINEGTLIVSDDTQFGENFVFDGEGEVISNDTERFFMYISKYYGDVVLTNKIIDSDKVNYGTLTLNECTLNSKIVNNGRIIIDENTEFGANAQITGSGEIVINDFSRILPYVSSINGNYIISDEKLTKPYAFYGSIVLNNCTITSLDNINYATLYLNNCTVDVGEDNTFLTNLQTVHVSKNTKINGKINDLVNGVIYEGAPKTYVINQATVSYYFDNVGLTSLVNPGDTLDVQGRIILNRSLTIDKPVNIISSTKDGYIDLNTTSGDYFGGSRGNAFVIGKSGSYTNVTGVYFHNTQLWLYNTNHVTLDGISAVVENQRIGSGVGVTSIRANSTYVTVKNSYFHTTDNEGSSTLVLAWADYCTIENNTIEGDGFVGNLLYITTYNVEIPEDIVCNAHNKLINNRLRGPETPSATCYGICICGVDNLVDNNTINSKGSGIMFQWGSGVNGVEQDECLFGSGENIVSNNKLYGGCGIQAGDIIYNNYMEGKLSVSRAKAYNNTANDLYVGPNAEITNNTILGKVTFDEGAKNSLVANNTIKGNIEIPTSVTNVTLSDNDIIGSVTLDGSYNKLSNNRIRTSSDYAVYSNKLGVNNTLTDNYMVANGKVGADAVSLRDESNTIKDSTLATVIVLSAPSESVVNKAVQVTIKLMDKNGNVVKAAQVTVTSSTGSETVNLTDGTGVYQYTPTAIGQDTVTVKYLGNESFYPSTNSAKITVKSAQSTTPTKPADKTPAKVTKKATKITAKNKKFKAKTKVKKYTITLKAGKNPVKKVQVTIKIGKKTYKAKTNNKGKATFKIKKLTKKGKYKAVIKFKGNKNYKASSKKVKITIK